MKGPHFFEKRKKEMARQQKAKEKADRKAQRKAGVGKEPGEGGEDGDEFLDVEGVGADVDGVTDGGTATGDGAVEVPGPGEAGRAPKESHAPAEHAAPVAGALRGTTGG